MNLETLIARHTAGLGGRRALRALQTMHMQGRMVEPKFTLEDFNVFRMKPHFQKVWFPYGNSDFSEGYDGRVAWEKPVGTEHAHPVGGQALTALQHALQLPGPFCPLSDFVKKGHRLEWMQDEIVEGLLYHVLKATLSDGFEKVYYMEASSGLLARSRDIRALHPSIDPGEKHIETVRSDFRLVDGVMVAFRETQRDWVTGEELTALTWQRVSINVPLAAADFEMP